MSIDLSTSKLNIFPEDKARQSAINSSEFSLFALLAICHFKIPILPALDLLKTTLSKKFRLAALPSTYLLSSDVSRDISTSPISPKTSQK